MTKNKKINVEDKVFEHIDVDTSNVLVEDGSLDAVNEFDTKNEKNLKNIVKVESKKTTESTFGKAKVIVDKIVVYETNVFTNTVRERVLKNGDTFYYDKIHTDGDKQFVSWKAIFGRNYTLLKDTETGKSPIVKIG